jgi:hypothetical protein
VVHFDRFLQHNPNKGKMSVPSKVSYRIEELYKIEGGKIIVDLNEKHSKLYSTSKKQLEMIQYIEGFVKVARGLNMAWLKVERLLGNIMRSVKRALSGHEINSNELMHKYPYTIDLLFGLVRPDLGIPLGLPLFVCEKYANVVKMLFYNQNSNLVGSAFKLCNVSLATYFTISPGITQDLYWKNATKM